MLPPPNIMKIWAGQAALSYRSAALYRPLMRQAPAAMYWASGTRNHRFQPSAAPAALHRPANTGRRKVRLAAIRQNSRQNSPAIRVVSRWVCSSPVKATASGTQHQGRARGLSAGWV